MASSSEVPEHRAGRVVLAPCREGPPRAVLQAGWLCPAALIVGKTKGSLVVMEMVILSPPQLAAKKWKS